MAHRFALTMRVPDSDEPGIVMHDDGTIWWVKQDGSEVQLGAVSASQARAALEAMGVEDGATEGQVPAIGADGEVEFVDQSGGGSQPGTLVLDGSFASATQATIPCDGADHELPVWTDEFAPLPSWLDADGFLIEPGLYQIWVVVIGFQFFTTPGLSVYWRGAFVADPLIPMSVLFNPPPGGATAIADVMSVTEDLLPYSAVSGLIVPTDDTCVVKASQNVRRLASATS